MMRRNGIAAAAAAVVLGPGQAGAEALRVGVLGETNLNEASSVGDSFLEVGEGQRGTGVGDAGTDLLRGIGYIEEEEEQED